MKYNCRTCKKEFIPTQHQIKKSDWRCLACRRISDKAWRKKRKENGNPVISTKMPLSYHREYQKKYSARPEVKKHRAEQMRRYSKSHLRFKHMARWMLNRALKWGKITKQLCKVCGRKRVQAHHKDYSKPLDVVWLCRKHHRYLHAKAEGSQ